MFRVQKETDAGIMVSGAKVVATSAAITHYNFMGQSSKTATEDLDMSLMFMVPIDAPGLKLICRTSYEKAALLQRLAIRLSAVVTIRRERRDLHPRQRVRPLGGRVHLSRPCARAEFLSAVGIHARLPVPGLHPVRRQARLHLPACWRRRCAAPAATRRAATRCCLARRSRGATCSGRCRTRWRTIPTHGSATPCCRTCAPASPTASSRRTPIRGSRTSSSAPSLPL